MTSTRHLNARQTAPSPCGTGTAHAQSDKHLLAKREKALRWGGGKHTHTSDNPHTNLHTPKRSTCM